MLAHAASTCPKRMVHGPCGGVRPSGGCEVDAELPCPWAHGPIPRWDGTRPPTREVEVPYVVTDLHVVPRDLGSLRSVAGRLAGTCDAVLVGDHGGARNDFPPSFMAAALIDCGVRPWVTLSCRDRNRVALGAELAALAALGVAGVHCVTGDWQGLAGSAGESKVFDLDCLRLVELARAAGVTVSVSATPAAPPVGERPRHLADKVAAGAELVIVNHCGGPGVVAPFVDAAQQAGATVPFVACVAVTADPTSLAALARLPGVRVDDAAVRESMRPDPVDVAVAAAAAMVAIPGVAGVNLSGSASSHGVDDSARIMAQVGRGVLASATRR